MPQGCHRATHADGDRVTALSEGERLGLDLRLHATGPVVGHYEQDTK